MSGSCSKSLLKMRPHRRRGPRHRQRSEGGTHLGLVGYGQTRQKNVALSPLGHCFDGDILMGEATSHVALLMASNMESVICSSALDVSIGLASSVLICTRFNLSFLLYSSQSMAR